MRSADRCKGIGYVQYHNEVCYELMIAVNFLCAH